MLRLVVRRLLQLIPTLLGLSVLLFLWLNRLPGGPASAILGERATHATGGATGVAAVQDGEHVRAPCRDPADQFVD
ncbi:hypothetical protein ACWEQJ_35445, partial [Streptomyces cyaneofuscatus]